MPRPAPAALAPSERGDATRDLTAAISRGDGSALACFYEAWFDRAFDAARSLTGRDESFCLDVVQDAFIKAHRHLDKFEGQASFYTWLYRIVMNLAIDHLRKHRRQRVVDFPDAGETLDEGALGEDSLIPRIIGGNPGRALLDREIRDRIAQALDELSDNHRAVLVMRELEGLSYEEMAQAMGCSKGTIMSRLFHARRNMQKRLLDLYDRPANLAPSDEPDRGVESGTDDHSS